MLTLSEALARFDAKSKLGVTNRVTGDIKPLAPSRRGPIISHVTSAVRHAIKGDPFLVRLDADALMHVDVTPFLATLPQHAELAARDDNREHPETERSNVALFVSVVTGKDAVRARKQITPERLTCEWHPLYEALVALAEREPRKRGYTRLLVRFAELARANGVIRPHDVPDDFNAIHAWGSALRFSRKDVHEALGAFRCAADQLGDKTIARAYDTAFAAGIGIRSLPDWIARCRAAGLDGDPMAWSVLDMVEALGPQLGAAIRVAISEGRAENHSPAYAEEMAHCGSWIVASLIRLGEPTKDMTLADLFLVRRVVVVARTTAAKAEQIAKQGQAARYAAPRAVGDGSTEQHSLLHCCLDVSAPISYAASPLRLSNSVHEHDPIPVYTESLVANLTLVFLLTQRFFGDELGRRAPQVWGEILATNSSLRLHVATYNKPRLLVGRKAKKLVVALWPQAVCMGLPYLRRAALEARRAVDERQRSRGHLESRTSSTLLLQYYETLRTYVVTAILLDDSLRGSNYSGALANVHFLPTPIIEGGKWRGFAAVRTAFRGDDEPGVRLKRLRRGSKEVNERVRPLSPGIVDMDLLFEWWTKARPFYLAQAGLIPSVDAFDPAFDRFAVFPTGRPDPAQRADRMWRGQMSEETLSGFFGRALHEISVEVLGHSDLPAWDDPARKLTHRGLFGAHIVRQLVGTYFGGVRDRWREAEYRSNDCRATLQNHYVAFAEGMNTRLHARGPTGAFWFDTDIDPTRPTDNLPLLDTNAVPRRAPRQRRAG
jgi:hypothetical protein